MNGKLSKIALTLLLAGILLPAAGCKYKPGSHGGSSTDVFFGLDWLPGYDYVDVYEDVYVTDTYYEDTYYEDTYYEDTYYEDSYYDDFYYEDDYYGDYYYEDDYYDDGYYDDEYWDDWKKKRGG